MSGLSCGTQDLLATWDLFSFTFRLLVAACRTLVPRPGIEPGPFVVRAQNPNSLVLQGIPSFLSLVAWMVSGAGL